MSNYICFVPVEDKIAVVENSLACIRDIERALSSNCGSINLLLCELLDLD